MKYPYSDIRKVPLEYEGIASSAYAVQRCTQVKDNKTKWQECGVVSNNYLLVPNTDVRDLAQEIATESKLDWKYSKEFFDGRRYIYFMQAENELREICKDDDVALGMGFWNSYDGSTALQFRTFLMRLVCTNGMMTKDFMNLVKFKHNKSSEGYEKQITDTAKVVDNCGTNIEEVVSRMRKMSETSFNLDMMAHIRNNVLNEIPVTLWGKISTRFLSKMPSNEESTTLWDFYNSCTDVLWHDEKPTIASFNHNEYITDTLLKEVL